ncbi:MAG: GIY-YIG nuclease family protein [Pseudomonadales bacterium]|nr:GIY-YIG nuclease family protein [Candidatus Woesebacteria bacterium]MCB9802081.1 GIY-YIG nuclease family protein [Pseudomonadales bacterium]
MSWVRVPADSPIPPYYTYCIYNPTAHKIYIGITQHLNNRLDQHNQQLPVKKPSFTHRFPPFWEYLYIELCGEKSTALYREKQLKSSRGRSFLWSLLLVRLDPSADRLF